MILSTGGRFLLPLLSGLDIMSRFGFTLIEIIIVIVILGVLATLALPRITPMQEKAIVSEGVSDLSLIFGAQKRYLLDHDPNYDTSADCSGLDVTISPTNFDAPKCDTAGAVGSIQRSDARYTIKVDSGGKYTCEDGTMSCDTVKAYLPK